jgi:hypothetical protein
LGEGLLIGKVSAVVLKKLGNRPVTWRGWDGFSKGHSLHLLSSVYEFARSRFCRWTSGKNAVLFETVVQWQGFSTDCINDSLSKSRDLMTVSLVI